MQGTFDCCVQGHPEVIRCISYFPIFGNLVSENRLLVERSGPKFGPRGTYLDVGMFMVILAIARSSPVSGHSVHFRFLTGLHSLNSLHSPATWLLSYNNYMAVGYKSNFSLSGKWPSSATKLLGLLLRMSCLLLFFLNRKNHSNNTTV